MKMFKLGGVQAVQGPPASIWDPLISRKVLKPERYVSVNSLELSRWYFPSTWMKNSASNIHQRAQTVCILQKAGIADQSPQMEQRNAQFKKCLVLFVWQLLSWPFFRHLGLPLHILQSFVGAHQRTLWHLHRQARRHSSTTANSSRSRLSRTMNNQWGFSRLLRRLLSFPQRGRTGGRERTAATPNIRRTAFCLRTRRLGQSWPVISTGLIGLGFGKIGRTRGWTGGSGRSTVEVLSEAGKTYKSSARLGRLLHNSWLTHAHTHMQTYYSGLTRHLLHTQSHIQHSSTRNRHPVISHIRLR